MLVVRDDELDVEDNVSDSDDAPGQRGSCYIAAAARPKASGSFSLISTKSFPCAIRRSFVVGADSESNTDLGRCHYRMPSTYADNTSVVP